MNKSKNKENAMQLHLIASSFNLNGINKIVLTVFFSQNSKNFRKHQAN